MSWNKNMKFLPAVEFSAKELQDLAAVTEACVRVERRVRHLAMLPNCLGNLKSAINGILISYRNKFDVSFNGFMLGYRNVEILTDRATLINDDCYIHFDIEANFYIFSPEVGCKLFGIVNKKGVDHIGCLVHKCFHVAIPRSTDEREGEWLGSKVNIGDQVTFEVEVCDFTGSLPYIRGRLINLRSGCETSVQEDEVDMSKPPKKKKKNKHAECDMMGTAVEWEKFETKHKKRKGHFEGERGTGAERKKKKQKVEDNEAVYCEAPENEDLYFTHLSSGDAEYGSILEAVKETYLNEAQGNTDSKAHKERKKKKHKLGTDKKEGKVTVAEVAQDLIHADEGNGDELKYYAPSVKRTHKDKKKHKEKLIVDIPEPGTPMRACMTSGKQMDNLHVSSAALAFISNSDAFLGTIHKETDFAKDLFSKGKKKLKECDSHNMEALHVQSKAETFTPEKSTVMDKMESNSFIKDGYIKKKKEKMKKRDLHSDKLSPMQNKNDKCTANEELSLASEEVKSLVSTTVNVDEGQVTAVPSVADLLNRVKSELKVNSPKKHKKKEGKKQHISKEAKDKTSVLFDPTTVLADYMSKFGATGKDGTENEWLSSKEGAADTTASNMSFRSSFPLTGAGMADAADRKRKKMNKGKGDAIPVRRSLPLVASSHSYSAADSPVGQNTVMSHRIENFSRSLKSPTDECDVLLKPEKCVTHNEVSKTPKTGIYNTLEMSLARPKERPGTKLHFSSPKQVPSPEKPPSRSILSQKRTSESHLSPEVSALSRKNSKEGNNVNSHKTKDHTPVKSHGSYTGGGFNDASSIPPYQSDVVQRLKSPSGDSRTSAGMPEISPLETKSVNEVSTALVKETVTTEINVTHKTKKKHKEKKSKMKGDNGRESIERRQKKKNAHDHKRNKGELELIDRREEHKEENGGTKGTQDKSKEKDTKGNLDDLKMLTSKLFSSFLQQENL